MIKNSKYTLKTTTNLVLFPNYDFPASRCHALAMLYNNYLEFCKFTYVTEL